MSNFIPPDKLARKTPTARAANTPKTFAESSESIPTLQAKATRQPGHIKATYTISCGMCDRVDTLTSKTAQGRYDEAFRIGWDWYAGFGWCCPSHRQPQTAAIDLDPAEWRVAIAYYSSENDSVDLTSDYSIA